MKRKSKYTSQPKVCIKPTHYSKPRLFRIKLDPEQAVIATCKSGGAYFQTAPTNACVGGAFVAPLCRATPKGAATVRMAITRSYNARAS